ncbi:ExbD/TolR family protein [Paralimibaculum aggregatum]|uniref:ExbD/TolR family protein n=1 Tax=Paralimibaculum aggregatum TaxID=3036245 RepID=UPI002552E623|nr:biopolymer transporter ExbD [Limibaculum sp. NKW23]
MIPLTPLVDVMLILLVFFMVTSTYLDLRMIPTGPGGEAESAGAASTGAGAGAAPVTLLLRLDGSGAVVHRGRALSAGELESQLASAGRVLILPSGTATAQDLVGLLEAVTGAGVADVRIVRLEARP